MAAQSKNTVTLIAGGDISPRREPVDTLAEHVLPLLREGDLRFGQCEKTYTERSLPQFKHGRPLPPHMASIWKTAGIDIISMASNHTMDYGPDAFLDTIKLFRSMGKHVIGGGKDITEGRTPVIVERNGVKIAFLGYCSVLPEGHEAGPEDKAGCTPMRAYTFYRRSGDPHEDFQPGTPPIILTVPYEQDLAALKEDIKRAKQQADVVVMSIHWGVHHIPKHIATYQPVVAHAAIDAGADLILGHHAHCIKAIEVYKGKVCFYSMGNFMADGGEGADGNYWDLHYFHVDPECTKPKGRYGYPSESRKTMVAKIIFSKSGVERVSFFPAFINPEAQPTLLTAKEPKFDEVVKFVDWVSELYPHKFRVEGNEVIIDTSV